MQGWQKGTLLLAYQSFGVVYGDLCISPVYVYKNTFSGKLRLHEEDEEILGVLSLVFWSLTLVPLLKYIILVLGADDNGEGRRVRVGTRVLSSTIKNYRELYGANVCSNMSSRGFYNVASICCYAQCASRCVFTVIMT